MKIAVYNHSGEKTKEANLSARIFGVKAKPAVIHQVVVAQEANARLVLADTKDRSEVSGGGKKPWRQKGTGRARQGSIRSPQWKGGGAVFGPKSDRNFSKKINKKQKQLALAMCLSERLASGSLLAFEDLSLPSGKTKELNQWFKALQDKKLVLPAAKKFLLVLAKQDAVLVRASMNLAKIKVILADSLNCRDILNSEVVLADEKALAKIEKHYQKIKEKK